MFEYFLVILRKRGKKKKRSGHENKRGYIAKGSFAKGAFGGIGGRKSIAGILLKFRGGIQVFSMFLSVSSTLFPIITLFFSFLDKISLTS